MPDVILYSSNTSGAILTQSVQGVPGTLASPTGTGFVHVTSGTIDGAARAVNLASSDVTGVLPLTNQSAPTGTGPVLVSAGAWAAASGPIQLGSGSSWVTGQLPVGNLANGSAAQLLVTNAGATAPAWVSASQDVSLTAAGAFTVTGLQGKALPALAAGVLQYSGSAWALSTVATTSIAPGTSGQLLMSNATPATTWTTMSGDTTISATGVLTVSQAQGGEYLFGATTGLVTIASGATTPGILQAATASATPAPFTITPQSSGAGVSSNGSSCNIALSNPGASGTPGSFGVTGGGSSLFNTGYLPGTTIPAIWLGQSSLTSGTSILRQNGTYSQLNAQSGGAFSFLVNGSYIGIAGSNFWEIGSIANASAYGGTNSLMIDNGSSPTSLASNMISLNSVNGAFAVTPGGSTSATSIQSSAGLQLFSATASFGGGIGVLALANATTQPTSTPSGGLVLAAKSGGLAVYDSSAGVMTFNDGTISNNFSMTLQPAAGGPYQITIQGGNNSGTSSSGGLCLISGGNATGTSTFGGALTLSSGSGTSSNGAIDFQLGGTTNLIHSGTTVASNLIFAAGLGAGVTCTMGMQATTTSAAALFNIQGQSTNASSGTGGALQIITGQGTGTSGTAGSLTLDSATGSTTAGAWKWNGPALATSGSTATGGFSVPALVKGFPVTINGVAYKFLVCLP